MTDHLRVIKDDVPAHVRTFAMTSTAADILRSFKMVQDDAGTLTMVAGIPGAGKSEAIKFHKATNADTLWHTMVAGEGKIWDVAAGLMEMLDMGAPNSRRMREERHRIAEAIGPHRLVVIDEAQYLSNYNPRGGFNFDAYEWLRALAEEGMFSIAFCGDLALVDAVNSVPQLRRRMVRPVIIRTVPKADVAKIAERWAISDPAMLDALAFIARRHGGIGDVVKVIQHAKRFSDKAISPESLMAAIHDLKLAPMGGQK